MDVKFAMAVQLGQAAYVRNFLRFHRSLCTASNTYTSASTLGYLLILCIYFNSPPPSPTALVHTCPISAHFLTLTPNPDYSLSKPHTLEDPWGCSLGVFQSLLFLFELLELYFVVLCGLVHPSSFHLVAPCSIHHARPISFPRSVRYTSSERY